MHQVFLSYLIVYLISYLIVTLALTLSLSLTLGGGSMLRSPRVPINHTCLRVSWRGLGAFLFLFWAGVFLL